ncbi:hypothetical protein SEA_ZITCH_58 [Gordonia Phage Zitch]|uniref:Uncharacterized protein n=1 Tax=Gordonia Phage Zitch TaxID=2743909 RepID=A0A7G3VBK2_9CAUD|nr:hypothetical protein J1774_gp58 [Gordonia Phage Zitch]QKY78504.1 hypothetical protein SEA_ZITCH_58 [Gordonia Phage Zitch]
MSNYVRLYPWTMRHPSVLHLSPRARLAYVELLAESCRYPGPIPERFLARLIRKDHRAALIAVGLIVDNGDDTYSVVQPPAAASLEAVQ